MFRSVKTNKYTYSPAIIRPEVEEFDLDSNSESEEKSSNSGYTYLAEGSKGILVESPLTPVTPESPQNLDSDSEMAEDTENEEELDTNLSKVLMTCETEAEAKDSIFNMPKHYLLDPKNQSELLKQICLYINQIIIKNGGIKNLSRSRAVHSDFFRSKVQSIPLDLFLHQLAEKTQSNNFALVVMLVYLQNYCDQAHINYLNINLLLTVSLLVSNKLNNDFNYNLGDYAEFLGLIPAGYKARKEHRINSLKLEPSEIKAYENDKLQIEKLKRLEFDLLSKIGFEEGNTFVPKEIISEMLSKLENVSKTFDPKVRYVTLHDIDVADLGSLGGIPLPVVSLR